MTPHNDIPRDALPAVVGTLAQPKREPLSTRFLFLLWLVVLFVATAVVASAIMALRAIGW